MEFLLPLSEEAKKKIIIAEKNWLVVNLGKKNFLLQNGNTKTNFKIKWNMFENFKYQQHINNSL